ncbi:hypothetical protein JHK82_055506 [Glycine max]|nr:hypothetical protein JHK82_055506 [Glycine max]
MEWPACMDDACTTLVSVEPKLIVETRSHVMKRKFDDGPWEDMRKFDDKISTRDYDNFQSVMFWVLLNQFSEWLVFEGISVDESGRQHYLDASVAYKRVVLNAIDYISKFGYSKE